MLSAIRERLARGREDEGFTLIELMVVVLIIAILIAIAIPTFLGARKRAQDKQAQSNIRIALGTEETVYTDNQQYTSTAATLQTEEGSLVWTATGSAVEAALRKVSVEEVESTSQGVVLKSWSSSGTLFCLLDIQSDLSAGFRAAHVTAGTWYAKVPNALSTADCPADISDSSW